MFEIFEELEDLRELDNKEAFSYVVDSQNGNWQVIDGVLEELGFEEVTHTKLCDVSELQGLSWLSESTFEKDGELFAFVKAEIEIDVDCKNRNDQQINKAYTVLAITNEAIKLTMDDVAEARKDFESRAKWRV